MIVCPCVSVTAFCEAPAGVPVAVVPCGVMAGTAALVGGVAGLVLAVVQPARTAANASSDTSVANVSSRLVIE